MTNLQKWGLQVLIMAVAFSIFFGLIVGYRGSELVLFVVFPSLLLPTVIWLGTRSSMHSRKSSR